MLKHFAVLFALAIGSVTIAHATPITGTLSIDGDDTYTASTITFLNAAIAGGPGANTGSFSVLTDGNTVTMFPGLSGPLPYMTGENNVPAMISPIEVMSTSEGGETFDFFMTDYDAQLVSGVTGCLVGTCLDITGDGFFTGSGTVNYTQTPGNFTFTTQETPGQTSTSFSASGIAATPEPASLVLLGTSLLGVAGFARRRFSV